MCPGTVWFGWVWVRVRVWESDKQKKWSKVYSFCFSFWVLSCSILVEKFLKKKVEKSKFWKGVFSIKTRENRYDERSPGTVLRREIHRFVKAWVFEISIPWLILYSFDSEFRVLQTLVFARFSAIFGKNGTF